MRSTTVAPLVLLGLAACGGGGASSPTLCSSPGPDGGTTQNPDPNAAALSVTIDRGRARVADQLATFVPVQVHRDAAHVGDVTVALEGAAAWGIVANPLTIPAGSDVGLLEIHGFATSPSIANASATVVARLGDAQASVGLELDVSYRSGAPDYDFGTNGVSSTHTVAADVGARIATMSDGRYVVAGARSGNSLVLRRHLADGQPDVAFFGSGEMVQTIGAGTHQVNDLALDSDGRILVGGFVGSTGFLARYLPNGQPDDAFGTSGIAFLADGEVQGVRIRPDGRLVVVDSNGLQCHLRGLDAQGQPDASFAAGAAVTVDRGAADYCSTLALRGDGSVVVLGSDGAGAGYAVSFDAQGAPDVGYGASGVCTLDPNGNGFDPSRSLVLADGRMIVASSHAVIALSTDCHGSPVFGTDGYLPTSAAIGDLTADGHRIYLASSSGNQVFVCATFLDGVPDLAFGPNGCGPGSAFAGTPFPNGLAVVSDGTLLTVGTVNLGPGDFDPFVIRHVGFVR